MKQDFNIVCMIPVYNDGDIIREIIEYFINEKIQLVVLDNGSTDESYRLCKELHDKGLIKFQRIDSSNYDWPLILRTLYDMALTEKPDWLIHCDSDEFLESGIANVSLKDAIIQEDRNGKNLIQFDCFEFFMTDNDNNQNQSIKEKLQYYSWQYDYVYRAWKHTPGTRPEVFGGHLPNFPPHQPYKIAERKFVLRHYRFRSIQQARKKIEDRIRKTKNTPEEMLGWYHQYQKIEEIGFPMPIDHKLLTRYEENNQWNYEWKYHPYLTKMLPRQEDIFSEDGKLIHPHPTYADLNFELKLQEEKIKSLESKLQGNFQ